MVGIDIPFWVWVAVGLGLLTLGAWLISKVGKAGADKLTSITLDHITKGECVSGSKNHGELPIPNLTKFSDISWLDIATQGFSLETNKGKLRWRKKGNKCFYTIERIWVNEEGKTMKQESKEEEVSPCP